MYKAIITVKLRPSILDPEGKAIEHALGSMGYSALKGVRLGKEIELIVNTGDRAEAERLVDEASRRLLANTVMEDYSFTLTEA
jgi:phosphoribosylformylglycinamidine synthase subunit PurS